MFVKPAGLIKIFHIRLDNMPKPWYNMYTDCEEKIMTKGKPVSMRAFEKSKADQKADKSEAKRAKMPLAKYEKTAASRKADRGAIAKMNSKKKR